MERDIRWQLRFNNYKKALPKLKEIACDREYLSLTEIEKEGLIQRFEYTFELAWKTLQDMLAYKGYQDITGPNPVLEQALQDGYIKDEQLWRSMKKSRELTSHTYDSNIANDIAANVVNNFYGLLHDLEIKLEMELSK